MEDFMAKNVEVSEFQGPLTELMQQIGGKNGQRRLREFNLWLKNVTPEFPTELQPDFIIRVDRSVKPSHPDWMTKLMHPSLELVGPAEYDLNTLVEWLHDDQKNGSVEGNTIYKKFKKDDALADCLGLTDLLAIQAKGVEVFRKLFKGKAVFGWRSVVRGIDGGLRVPYLIELDKIVVRWDWLGHSWDSDEPALRFSLPAQAGKPGKTIQSGK